MYQVERAGTDALNNDNTYEIVVEPSHNENRSEHIGVTNPGLEVSGVHELAENSGTVIMMR